MAGIAKTQNPGKFSIRQATPAWLHLEQPGPEHALAFGEFPRAPFVMTNLQVTLCNKS
jgi:hypothetical protein